MKEDDIIRMAQEAKIPLNLTDERVTLEKLELFGDLYVSQKRNIRWGRDASPAVDVSKAARETKASHEPDIYLGDKPADGTRGFWLFWLRPEGGTYRRGINLTICRGFILCLVTSKHKYRFRFRHGIKPRFMWSKEEWQNE